MNSIIAFSVSKIRKIILYLFLIISCSGCYLFSWDRTVFIYHVTIKNNTQDTINVVIGDGGKYSHRIDNFLPDSSWTIRPIELSSNHEKENADVIREKLFTGGDSQWLLGFKVYKGDSLIIQWDGPPCEMGTSTHHFYNYSSWECYDTSKFEGLVLFKINDSDLK
ncbi:MAG: hypothetical protein RBS13_03295 [Bacteroidales bacterium]|jgi:hypothetical protein|nr:hypothetical protein [Bacteroidales bacterium]